MMHVESFKIGVIDLSFVQTRISVLLIPAEIKLLSAVTEIKCAL
jgi:hypothetical protein